MKVLITGAAGFIGYHVASACLSRGYQVIGLDDLNDYYDVSLKQSRLALLSEVDHFEYIHASVQDKTTVADLFRTRMPTHVIHLAAQAGVRYSLEHPDRYVESNIVGFLSILEACRDYPIEHLLYASTSSVYGANTKYPYHEGDTTDRPLTLYAATKKSNELMAHAYSHLFNIPTTGLRFFTVYGPWGRPDMALFKFTKAILAGQVIEVFNNGQMARDFTYIDDIVEGFLCVLGQPVQKEGQYALYNIGRGEPITLLDMIQALEVALGRKAIQKMSPMQPGDVLQTYADTSSMCEIFDYSPKTPFNEGVERFVSWYLDYYS